jgi:hypothetical protein
VVHYRFGGKVGVGARSVLDDERLAEPFGEPLAYQSRGDVSCAAGRKADDQTYRPRRQASASVHVRAHRPDSERLYWQVAVELILMSKTTKGMQHKEARPSL